MARSHPSIKKSPPQLTLGLALLAGFSLSLLLATLFLLITVLGVGSFLFYQLNAVARAANTTPIALISQGITGWHAQPKQTNGFQNILILGTDSLVTRGDAPPLTDTIMIASLELKTGQVRLLSLPRDLWSEKQQIRINALYWQGLEENSPHPTQLVTQEITDLTGLPLHYTLVTSLETLGELIDLVGGVEVTVIEGFTDTQFPRTDVDVTVITDPRLLYETVTFEAGTQLMSGDQALKFIRSRKSVSSEGNDEARSARQQLVIEALVKRLQHLDPLTQPLMAGQLYGFYTQHFAQYLPVTDALATAKVLLPQAQSLELQGHGLSIYPQEPQGVIYHPPEWTMNGAWVYRVRDSAALKAEAQTKLNQIPTSPL